MQDVIGETLSNDQLDRIADYKRVPVTSIQILHGRMIFAGDDHIGYMKSGLALIDRRGGFAAIERNGDLRFREGRYYL